MTNQRSGFLSPAIFFTFDPQNLGFNRKCILDSLEKDAIDLETFQEFLIRTIEKKENIMSGNINNTTTSSSTQNINRNLEQPGLIGNAEILQQQRREMENILREEERQKRLKIEEEKRVQREVTLL